VKRADVGQIATVIGVLAQQCEYASAHFTGGFIGEGNGQNAARRDVLLRHQIGYTVREGLGFARSRAGQN